MQPGLGSLHLLVSAHPPLPPATSVPIQRPGLRRIADLLSPVVPVVA